MSQSEHPSNALEETTPTCVLSPGEGPLSELMAHSGLSADLLKACIHCGMCLPACPTYLATGSEAESPRGRIYLMRQWMEGRLDGEQVAPHLDQCLGCQGCQTACPSGVQYGSLLFQARSLLAPKKTGLGWLQRQMKRAAFRWLLPYPDRLHRLADWLEGYQTSGLQSLLRQTGLLKLLGLSKAEALAPAVEMASYRPLNEGMAFGNPSDPKVALMTGCVMDVFYNRVHWATVEALLANRYYVVVPPQTCCGALAHHAGEEDIALSLARENISSVMSLQPDWIVLNSAGCGATMKDYDALLNHDGSPKSKALCTMAKTFSSRVIDVMALLAQKPLADSKSGPMRPVKIKATYHPPCHLHHAQGVKTEPLSVLEQIPGLTLIPLAQAEQCCGSAGIYNMEQPELSAEILSRKVDHLEKTGARVALTGNPGCLLQLVSGLKDRDVSMTVMHPIEAVAMAYGFEPPAGFEAFLDVDDDSEQEAAVEVALESSSSELEPHL